MVKYPLTAPKIPQIIVLRNAALSPPLWKNAPHATKIPQITTRPDNGPNASHVATPPKPPILNANGNIIFSLYKFKSK